MANIRVSEMVDLAKRYKALQKEFIDAIEESLHETPTIDGVKKISDSPACATVSFNTIMKHNMILSPEYYSQETQTEAVLKKLKNCCGDIEKMQSILEKMIQTKRVEGNTADKHVQLNPNTIETIQKIYEGFNTPNK